jgi:hypothetical protein
MRVEADAEEGGAVIDAAGEKGEEGFHRFKWYSKKTD